MANSLSLKNTVTRPLANPFPGLRPFSMDEAHLFFGREGQIGDVLSKLKQRNFVAITGSSGSGKSSLIYCGIIPSIINNEQWKLVVSRPGNAPIDNLVRSILDATASRIPGKAELAEISSHNKDIFKILRVGHTHEGNHYLIVIDQFEELFRYGDTSENARAKRIQLIDFIVEAARQQEIPILTIISMRSEFMGECSKFQDFTNLINLSSFLIPRMTSENLRKVIIGPAGVAGVEISPELTDRLLADMDDDPDQLPILQHALMRTWEYWRGHSDPSRPIGINDYLAIGGIQKALSRHADEAYDELSTSEKIVCEKIFRSITEKGSDNIGIRRPTEVSRLMAIAQSTEKDIIRIVNHFRAPGRTFLTPPPSVNLDKTSVIDISHEALMRIWDRLRNWVDEESASVTMYKRLAESAALYQIGKAGLWRPPDLQLATNWKAKNNPNLSWAIRHDPAYERTMIFLSASEQEFLSEEENKRRLQRFRLRRTRFFALLFGAISIIAIVLVLWTQKLNADKEQEVIEKENQMKLAEQKTLEAEEQRLIAEEALRAARQQTTRADSALYVAENRRLEAEGSAIEAANQTALAEVNLGEANRQRVLAVQNEQEAEAQRKQAERAKEEALQRRMLSTARSMAVKSIQISGDSDLKALLAYQAYLFANPFENMGHDVDMYAGLYKSLKALLGDNYNVYKGHTNAVRSISFLPNTSSFITSGSDGKLLKWNLNIASHEGAVLLSGRNVLENVKISPDGKWLVASESRMGLIFMDLANPSAPPVQLNMGADQNIKSIAIGPDNQTVYTVGLNSFIEIWNVKNKTVKKFVNTGSKVNALSLSPDGSILAVGDRDGKTIIWRTKGEALSNTIFNEPANPVQAIIFSPNGRYMACGTLNGNVLLFRADNFELIGVLSGHKARITDICFSPDSKKIATASYDGKVLFRETTALTNPPIVMDDNAGFVFSLGFSPDGNYIVSGSAEENRLIARPTSAGLLAGRICPLVKRNLTKAEWNTYIGNDIEYRETCPLNQTSEFELNQ